MQKKLLAILGVVLTLAVVLAACAPAEVTPETIIETVIVTEEVIKTVEVGPEGPRRGGWLDTIVMVKDETTDSAVARILADDIDVYAQASTDPEAFVTVKEEGLNYVETVGSYNEMTFNPAGPVLQDGTFNPFKIRRVREAMNLAVDRDYIAQEIMGGLAIPRYIAVPGVLPDYANFAATARELESKYAYDLEKADEWITAALTEDFDINDYQTAEELAELGIDDFTPPEKVDDVWMFNDEPITLINLIRVEDERLQIGHYVANQLEELGFTVDRQEKTSSEASPLWILGDPSEGLWHVYTGGWITTAISRDEGGNFQVFYSPKSYMSVYPLWSAYDITDEYDEVCVALYNNDFDTLEERAELFRTALRLSMEDSVRIWLVDALAYSPFDSDVSVTYDLAGGISGTPLWAHTLRYVDQVGGQMTYAMADLLVEPWNPLGGSNWVYDMAPQRAMGDFGTIYDPYTGLVWPQRIEKAEVTAVEGLPIGRSLDWVELEFVPEIEVPADAWMDWDAANQVFITAEENLGIKAAEAAAAVDAAIAAADEAATALSDAEAALTEAETAQEELADDATDEENDAAQAAVDEAQTAVDDATSAKDAADAAIPEAEAAAEAAAAKTSFTAKRKSVVYYPYDLFDTVTWHDGSPISAADFVMSMILLFDRGKSESPIFDEAQVGTLSSFLASFKGLRITSTSPLTIEYYSDTYQLDAEINVASFWPQYDYGEGSWHMLSIGMMADAAGELAFSESKADSLEVDQLGYTSGPSLEILEAKLDQALDEGFIPYEATLSQFMSEGEVAERYGNLKDFYADHGHFYVGTGPYILDAVFPVEKTLTLINNVNYVDVTGKWEAFGKPKFAEVEIDGPGNVTIGEEAVFDAYVTFAGEPFPVSDMTDVKFLLFDATGALVESGSAEFVEEGLYRVTLSAETTEALEAGSNKLEIAAVPSVVSVPTFAAIEFVTAE